MFAARVPPFAFVLHKSGGKPPCAEAHLRPSESKGHDNRARRAHGWRELCRRKRPWDRGKTSLFFSPVSLPTPAVFRSRTKANGGTRAAAPVKKARLEKS